MSIFSVNSAASTNATNVKASAGSVYGWSITNLSAALKFIRIYNKATAPVPASDAALIVARIALPAGATSNCTFEVAPHACSAGVGFDITGAMGDTNATAVAANDVVLNLFYK